MIIIDRVNQEKNRNLDIQKTTNRYLVLQLKFEFQQPLTI